MDYWNSEDDRNTPENRKVYLIWPFNFQGEGMEIDPTQPSTSTEPPPPPIQFDFKKDHMTFDTKIVIAGKSWT